MESVVFHDVYGRCSVVYETPDSVIIRSMDNQIHECLKSEIKKEEVVFDEHTSLKTLLKVQSGLISSINDTWGLFSQTAINLLPHQLWVCNRVMNQWPTRMLVADDVGLGKTIEAGIILLAATSSNRAKRILILTPAALTVQWQQQLKNKFNLIFDIYSSEAEKNNPEYWNTHNQVVASISTLRMDINGRYDKLLNAPGWDLVLIDEAHHIGRSDKETTLGYKLIARMEETGHIDSMVFFTATPHQGKDANFWYLMELLSPEDFNASCSADELYANLRKHMIRNKKTKVIDMNGNYLFKGLKTIPYEFSYTTEEKNFYNMLTSYIEEGYAYASDQSEEDKRLIGLVLTTLQKIAASSITAVRIALIKRWQKLIDEKDLYCAEKKIKVDEYGSESLEDISDYSFYVVNDEIDGLEQLIQASRKVKKESRIEKILNIIEENYPNENILLFTEYKNTQALMVKALRFRYGEDSVAFINGDNELRFSRTEIEVSDRNIAMDEFRKGTKRFLVSTDASSEGVDMQDACHILIHIDLPWNPMRMQQRVGRVFRYGQKKDVEVVYVRNLATVEGNVWAKLDGKIRNIMNTFTAVQGGEPEDLLDMVIGMQDASFYESLYVKALKNKVSVDSLDKWFNEETKEFGGKNALNVIKDITGHAQSFDLSFLKEVPPLDIKDLKPFISNIVELDGSKFHKSSDGYSFKTPEEWIKKNKLNINREYKDLVFNRNAKVAKICAVGSTVFNQALKEAISYKENISFIKGDKTYLVIRVFERITTESSLVKYVLLGYELMSDNLLIKIPDWKLFEIINGVLNEHLYYSDNSVRERIDQNLIELACETAKNDYKKAGVQFKYPDAELFAYLIGREGGRD